jgi:hypothetical protein
MFFERYVEGIFLVIMRGVVGLAQDARGKDFEFFVG